MKASLKVEQLLEIRKGQFEGLVEGLESSM